MKIILDNNHLTIFLNNLYLKDKNLNDKNEVEDFLGQLIKKIKFYYDLTLEGFINVWLYLDNNYGVVIKIEKEDLEYFDYFNGGIDMNIKVIETNFLYKMEELFPKDFLNKFIIYKYHDKFYLKPKEKLNIKEMSVLLENTKIIYRNSLEITSSSEIVGGW